ncbi:MAG: sugar nucleotide-binding protein, partial [Bacteroidales bacterium]|nr:sugar nucleotide-binding protein [Bacteroidales bacterium]
MKKILVTGAKGQLGTELRRLTRGRVSFIFTDIAAEEGIEALDICNEKGVREFVEKHDIGTIVNCAAFTDVEGAEDRKELCMKINVDGPSALAKAAKEAQAKAA